MSGARSSTSNGRARRASAATQKYFLGRVYADGRMVPFAVWDGVRSFSSEPPLPSLALEFKMRGAGDGLFGVIPVRTGKSARSLICDRLAAFDAIVTRSLGLSRRRRPALRGGRDVAAVGPIADDAVAAARAVPIEDEVASVEPDDQIDCATALASTHTAIENLLGGVDGKAIGSAADGARSDALSLSLQDDTATCFKPGKVPGTKSAVSGRFEHYSEEGHKVFRIVFRENPETYFKALVSLVPKELLLTQTVNIFGELTDEQIAETVEKVRQLRLINGNGVVIEH